MNQIEKITLDILSEAISGKRINHEENVDWKCVIQEMEKQGVFPLGYITLKDKAVMDSTIKAEYDSRLYNHLSMWYFMLEVQDQLVKLLEQEGYKFAIMKGLANAAFYPRPAFRSIGDVDVLVRQDEFEQIISLLQNNGYELNGEIDDAKHHVNFIKNGIVFEIHKRPAGTKRHYSKENQQLINYFQEGLLYTQIVEVEGYTFPILDPVRNGLMLLLHMAGHMQSGIGVRHLLDWAVYANRFADDYFWDNSLKDICKKTHVDYFASGLTKIVQQYIGVGENITWCSLVEDKKCESLINYLISQGDFGEKAGAKDTSAKFLTDSLGKYGLLYRINKSSQYSMPIITKYPFLKPVGWLYQSYRYIYKTINKQYSIKSFHADIVTVKERRQLFESLGIQDWQDN